MKDLENFDFLVFGGERGTGSGRCAKGHRGPDEHRLCRRHGHRQDAFERRQRHQLHPQRQSPLLQPDGSDQQAPTGDGVRQGRPSGRQPASYDLIILDELL